MQCDQSCRRPKKPENAMTSLSSQNTNLTIPSTYKHQSLSCLPLRLTLCLDCRSHFTTLHRKSQREAYQHVQVTYSRPTAIARDRQPGTQKEIVCPARDLRSSYDQLVSRSRKFEIWRIRGTAGKLGSSCRCVSKMKRNGTNGQYGGFAQFLTING